MILAFISALLGLFGLACAWLIHVSNMTSRHYRDVSLCFVFISIWVLSNALSTVLTTHYNNPTLALFSFNMIAPTIIMSSSLFLKFAISFSYPNRNFTKFRAIHNAITALLIIISPFHFSYVPDESLNYNFTALFPLFLIFQVANVLASLTILFIKARQSDLVTKKSAYWLIAGLVTFVVPANITGNFMPLLGNSSLIDITPLFVFNMFILTGYGMVRHKLFNITRQIVRTFAYVLSLTFCTLTLTLLLWYPPRLLQSSSNGELLSTLISFVLIVLGLFFSIPLRRNFDKYTNWIFLNDVYSTGAVLDNFSVMLLEAKSERQVYEGVAQLMKESVRPEASYISLATSESPFIKNIQKQEANGEGRIINLTPDLATKLSMETGYLKLIYKDGVPVAAWHITKKQSGQQLTKQDKKVIHVSSRYIAACLENIRSQQEIKQFNQTLKEKVSKATDSLVVTNKKLVLMNESKDDFIAMTSHQLRTPLTAMRNLTKMMTQDPDTNSSSLWQKKSELAAKSADKMVQIVNELLESAKSTGGIIKLRPSTKVIENVIANAIEEIEPIAAAKSISITSLIRSETLVSVDDDKLTEVLTSILKNSTEYSKANSEIVVSFATRADSVVIKISDQGIGIKPGYHEKVFERFYRDQSAAQSRPDGSGLGLYIARKLIELHNGSITAAPGSTCGTTFEIVLPLAPDPASYLTEPALMS